MGGELLVVVNPILEILELPNNFDVVSISPIVNGDNPNDLLINRKLSQSDFNNLAHQLAELSRVLVSKTNCVGINIIPWNTTILNEEGSLIVVTDLCQRLGELRAK